MTAEWFERKFKETLPPPYCSVDLRNSGYKIAPVDTNLFPAGFNNLHPDNMPQAIAAARKLAEDYVTKCQRIIIIPENHTRNIFYFESLAVLQSIFDQAGFKTKIGSLLEEINKPQEISLPSGRKIILESFTQILNSFEPCLILLNHDLSGGIPQELKNIKHKIAPPLNLGWWSRKKSDHFRYYQQVAELYAKDFNLDPWLINAEFDVCQNINFQTGEGEEALIHKVNLLLNKIKFKYKEYKINQEPYVVIKADSGTYGMGILTIKNTDQIKNLNKKDRTKMTSTKGNQKIDQVIIQEGVYSIETSGENKSTAEPVIYMIEADVIGGFYRIHPDKKPDENLNSPGMYFDPVDIFGCDCFDQYRTVAKLALLAAAREL